MDVNRIAEALNVNVDKKLESVLPCYKIDNHHYIVFWKEFIHNDDIEVILYWVDDNEKLFSPCREIGIFSDVRLVIVLGETDEDFKNAELLYGKGNGLNVLFFLCNVKNKQLFRPKGSVFLDSKYVKTRKIIDDILSRD